MKLTFTLKPDEHGMMLYYKKHPDLADLDSRGHGHTLVREAIAAWVWDGLIEGDEHDIYDQARIEED